MSNITAESRFEELLKAKLGEHYDRALRTFKQWGDNLAGDVANVLCHAVDKDKVDEVLTALEEHYNDCLQYQFPDIRGKVLDLGVNKTQVALLHIYQDILQLQPQPAQR